MKHNRDLQTYYDAVYKKGERAHYTQFLLQKGAVCEDFTATFAEVSWEEKHVLDVGCGTGDMCAMIAQAGATSVLGVDFAPQAIAEAKAKYTLSNLTFRCCDIWDLSGTFDTIVSNGTIEHMENPFALLQHLKTMLPPPRGSLIITCPNWLNPRGMILQTLQHLFRAPITLADRHYLTPLDFEEWAKELDMELTWSTVDHDWGGGRKMVDDFRKRLPNVSRDARWNIPLEQIEEFLAWLEHRVIPFKGNAKHEGAVGVYHFRCR